jgi:hypothetical protein
MLDWKEAARWYRARFLSAMRTIDHRTRLAAAEHTKRVALVNAMSELLPRMASGNGFDATACYACKPWKRRGPSHAPDCPYLKALEAVAEAGRSVEV